MPNSKADPIRASASHVWCLMDTGYLHHVDAESPSAESLNGLPLYPDAAQTLATCSDLLRPRWTAQNQHLQRSTRTHVRTPVSGTPEIPQPA
jgi:hypothetical protein